MIALIIAAAILTTGIILLNEYGWADLTGGTRNDLVFETRHKSYGAYEIRQKYSNRLIIAFVAVLGFISVAAVSPKFLLKSAPKMAKQNGPATEGNLVVEEIENEKKEEVKKEEKLPETPKTPDAPPVSSTPTKVDVAPVASDTKQLQDTTKHDPNALAATFNSKGDTSALASNNVPIKGGIVGGTGTDPNNGGGGTTGEPKTMGEVDKVASLERYKEILGKTIHIPASYIERGEKGGRIYVSFIVDEHGNVSSAHIKKGLDPELDREVKRAINAMPRWEPAILNGENVPVRMAIPVNIVID